MPISSGAAGRVDVGIDTSIAWAPDGVKKEAKPVKNCDSYLRRYLESNVGKKKHNSNILGNASQHLAGPDGENMDTLSAGVSRDPNTQQKNGGSDGDRNTSGKQPKEESLKKSKT
ncbi:unnamed protein product, partial [Coregonus sp. 'balchen']